MHKRKILTLVAWCCAFAMILGAPGVSGSSTEYNDVNYKTYGNLSEDSSIPSLFKNDDVFSNYKDYPPVISDGVEYVPLELFYGLSNVKINYSDDNSNFYIQNKDTNEYISFSVSNSYAVTGKNKVYETDVPNYYGVQYVPLRAVCDTVSIGCSTYNDGENRVYAIEIYTKDESLSAQELLQIHAPELYSTPEPEIPAQTYNPYPLYPNYNTDVISSGYTFFDTLDTGNQKTQENSETRPADEPKQPEAPKPPEYKKGNLMLFYTPEHFENADKTLDALDDLNLKAVFFVTEENILTYPATIRRIYTSGHTLGITFSEINDGLFADGVLEEKTRAAENALYEVAKIKTRLVYLGDDGKANILPDSVRERAEALGLCAVTLNADAKTDTLSTKKSAENMRERLKDIRKSYGSDTAFFKMHHTDSAITAAGAAAAVAMANKVITIELFDETKKA